MTRSMPPRRHQMRRVRRRLLAAVLLLGAALGSAWIAPPSARAHVEIDVGDGQYVMEVGFRDEPAFLGVPNAVYLHLEEFATGGAEPVEGLAATLTAEVTKDGQVFSPPLVPTGDGTYEANFVPTATGDYTFRITGAIGDATIDESVTSGPTTFNSVEPLSSIEFPLQRPDTGQIVEGVESARAEVATARMLALGGIGVGVLGLILAIVALARSGKPSPAALPLTNSGEPSGRLIR